MKEEIIQESKFCLEDKKAIKSFSQKIITDIKLKNRHYLNEIAGGNSQSRFLKEIFGIDFKILLKPGYYVDALVLKSSVTDPKDFIQKLQGVSIWTEEIFFNGKEHLAIRNVNTKEVYDNIYRLR